MVVLAVLDIFEKSPDYRRGDHVAGILCHISGISLKGYTHNLSVLQDWAARVAWVDSGINLHRQMQVHSTMGIAEEIDTRDDS